MHRRRRQPAARQAADRRDRARARRRSDAAAARRARGGPALSREAGARGAAAQRCSAKGMTILLVEHDMDFVMGLDRSAGRDGFRREARRRSARRHPARSASCSKRIWAASDMRTAQAPAAAASPRNCSTSNGCPSLRQGRGGARRVARTSAPGTHRHRHRSQRRRQDDAARGDHGPAAGARRDPLPRRRRSPLAGRAARRARPHARAREARAVRGDERRRQPRARRVRARAASAAMPRVARRRLRALSAARRAPRRSSPARCPAASGRCSRSAAR